MAQNSWEFYQQNEQGTTYPLYWICGLNAASQGGDGTGLEDVDLVNGRLYSVPFDQMRAMTATKIIIDVRIAGPAGAKCRVGIYQNDSDTNNVPKDLITEGE